MIVLLTNISIIFIPIFIYLLSISYNNNYINKYNNDNLLILLIIQVLFFVILKDYTKSIILINIPLLISYLKRK